MLNIILGTNRAIINELPGTTRDTIEEMANIKGIPVKLIDTAGIRETKDQIEFLGIEKTIHSINNAQIILWLLDASKPMEIIESDIQLIENKIQDKNRIIIVWNKIDLVSNISDIPEFHKYSSVKISAKNGVGIKDLFNLFEQKVWKNFNTITPEIAISKRHANFLEKILETLPETIKHIEDENWEIVSVNLKNIILNLASITGENHTIDIYDEIFSKFCIGK